MAVIFCNSVDGSDVDDGSTWALAKATMQAAITAAGAGGTVYCASPHADPTATVTYTFPVATGAPVTIISVDEATGAPPSTFERGATLSPTDANADMTIAGAGIFIGFNLTIDDNVTISADSFLTFVDCIFTGETSANWFCVQDDIILRFDRCVFDLNFTNFGWAIGGGSRFTCTNCSLDATATAQTIFMKSVVARGGQVIIENCDFSNGANGFDVIGPAALPGNPGDGHALHYNVSGCKLPDATSSIVADTFVEHGSRIEAYNNDNGNTIHNVLIQDFRGDAIDDIVTFRNATFEGTTGYSLKVTTNTNTRRGVLPFRFLLAEYWADAGKTHTVHFVSDGTDAFDSADLWCEFEGPDATIGALTISAISLDIAGIDAFGLGTPAALTIDADGAAEWTAEPASSTFYEISHDFSTTDQAGVHRVWVNLASGAAESVFVDPQIEVSV